MEIKLRIDELCPSPKNFCYCLQQYLWKLHESQTETSFSQKIDIHLLPTTVHEQTTDCKSSDTKCGNFFLNLLILEHCDSSKPYMMYSVYSVMSLCILDKKGYFLYKISIPRFDIRNAVLKCMEEVYSYQGNTATNCNLVQELIRNK